MALFIMDVADVTFKRKSDGHTVFTSTAQMSSLSQTVDEETIQGGIGSKPIYTVKSNKQMELSVRDATFDLEWLAMTQGVKIDEDKEVVVQKKYDLEVSGGTAAFETAPETGSEIHIINEKRKSQVAEIDGKVITVPAEFAKDGETIQAIVEEKITGRSLEMRADKFSEKYKVQYRTVVYDSETEEHVADLYIKFNEVSPSSAFEMSLENGSAFTPELTFIATADKKNVIGEWILEDITTP